MQRMILGSISLAAWAILSTGTLGCDVEEPGDEELARELEDEAADADEVDGDRPVGADELTAPSDPSAAANYFVPVGTHDSATCNTIAGWVKDGDTTAPTWVSIRRDAAYPYGEEVATIQANLYRGDLPFSDKNHGFSFATPASLKDGSPVTLYIHGINVDVNGNWDIHANSPLLNLTERTICCGNGCYQGPGGADNP